jgi:hypothetical protein
MSVAHSSFVYPRIPDSRYLMKKYLGEFAHELTKFANIGPRMNRMERLENNAATSENNINSFYSDTVTAVFPGF